jgi:hypothetical protein
MRSCKQEFFDLQYEKMLMLYLLSKSVQDNLYQITLTNKFLKKYFNVDRVYKARAEELANSIKPFFKGGGVSTMSGKTEVYVCTHNKDGPTISLDNIPAMAEMAKHLGLKTAEVRVECS